MSWHSNSALHLNNVNIHIVAIKSVSVIQRTGFINEVNDPQPILGIIDYEYINKLIFIH